jgi:hypothetical protein
MYLLSAIFRLSTPVAVCFFAARVAVAETTTVGRRRRMPLKRGRPVCWLSTRASISGIDATAQRARAFRRHRKTALS